MTSPTFASEGAKLGPFICLLEISEA